MLVGQMVMGFVVGGLRLVTAYSGWLKKVNDSTRLNVCQRYSADLTGRSKVCSGMDWLRLVVRMAELGQSLNHSTSSTQMMRMMGRNEL